MSGLTMKDSDKPFKKAEHRRARRVERARDLTVDEPPAEKAFGNPRNAPKLGKQWVDITYSPEAMRK